MNYTPYLKQGARNALGVLVYVTAVAFFLNNAQRLFGNTPDGPLTAVVMLLLFIVSALVTGALVLWQPLKLLADGKKAEAGALLCVTGSVMLLFLVAAGLLIALR